VDDDPVAGLAAAVETARRVCPSPDGVLLSGDLSDNAADAEYQQVRELVDRLGAPIYPLPGNHDRREPLRRTFDLPGEGSEPVQYAADVGALRLVVLDTTLPGEDRGELDADRLRWLDLELSAHPDTPTLIAMHHPPVRIGIPAWDEIGLPDADRRALAEVVSQHRQVRRLVAGHLHRTITTDFAGTSLLVVPSTYVQGKLDFDSRELKLAAEPPGLAIHAMTDGELVSHVQPVD
jgi:3',5'-cyclic-AMP phosphodiesterase